MNDHDYIDPDLTAELRALAAATPGIENTAIEERLLLAFSQLQRDRARRSSVVSAGRWPRHDPGAIACAQRTRRK